MVHSKEDYSVEDNNINQSINHIYSATKEKMQVQIQIDAIYHGHTGDPKGAKDPASQGHLRLIK